MDKDQAPDEPLTLLQAGAAQQHEMFMAYVEAGFTRPEALQIMIAMTAANIAGEEK